MIEPDRVLRPIHEAGGALRQLQDYHTAGELAAALQESWAAIERSLRLLLRGDVGAPDELRLAALDPAAMPLDRLLELLRRRNLISLELAGSSHELAQAAVRAGQGEPRATDADLALRAADRLEREVRTPPGKEAPIREVAHGAVEDGVLDEPPRPVRRPEPRVRPLALFAAGVALLTLIATVLVLSRSFGSDLREGVEAFQRGQLETAEQRFRAVAREAPNNITARLYLGRIYRRQQRYDLAAEELREAVRIDPRDADARRELGHLFLDLKQPKSAAEQYRRAVELEPEDDKNWIGLVRALRAAGDPTAEEVLRRAPAAAQAALSEAR